MTGAGWGGCCVSLVDLDEVDVFVERVSKAFNATPSIPLGGPHPHQEENIFVSHPGPGVAYLICGT